MKLAVWIIAVALIAASTQAHAQDRVGQGQPSAGGQALGDTLSLLYVVSGVRDNGAAAFAGTATTIHCTNASTVTESLQIIFRQDNGTIAGNSTFIAASAHTLTASTHDTNAYTEFALNTGIINSGVAFIFATTQFMFCTAMTIDASAAVPTGVSLHMVRFSPVAGTSE